MLEGRPRVTIARRDLASLSREKTIVLALLIQLFVAAFSSFLVVGLSSLYDPGTVSGDVEVAVTGDAADELLAVAAEQSNVRAVQYDGGEAAATAFEAGRVDAVLAAEHSDGRIRVTATAPRESLRKTLVVAQVRELLERLERAERVERAAFLDAPPVSPPPGVNASPYFGFSYTILLPLLVFLPVFISGSVVVDTITEEVERGTLELLRVAPVSLVEIVDGKAAAMAALAPAQAALWLALLEFNGIQVRNVALLLVLVAGLGLGLVGFGVGLSLAVPNRQRAQLLYSLVVLFLFTAATFLPEHPATTVARLAVGSPGTVTYALAAGYVALGVGVAAGVRAFVVGADTEGL